MPLKFRNLVVTPDDPVEDWGFEGMLAAIDRGDLVAWRKIVASVAGDPWGDVARTLDQALDVAEDSGVVGAMRQAVASIRSGRQSEERGQVAAMMRAAIKDSGLSQAEFARRIGTSASRLSTYASGKVTPSAVLLVRAQALADRT